MSTEVVCTQVARRLEAAFWSRASATDADAAHAAGCRSCGELMGALGTLSGSLSSLRPPEPDTDRARSIRERVASELSRAEWTARPIDRRVPGQGLPTGYARELMRILGWALIPLPLALFTYLQLFQFGGELLEGILPDWGLVAVGVVAASGAASWLAVVYGSIPLVAYRRLSRLDHSFIPPAGMTP